MRIGLLEDDEAIQEMLLLVLQDEGYAVKNYQDAEECVEDLTKAAQDASTPLPIDLMIIDWRLSGTITGTEVIQQLRTYSRLNSLPIILTTAATFSDIAILQNFHISLLEKPFSVDEMTGLVKQLIQPHSTTL